MAFTPAYRLAGPCIGLSVAAASHAAVTVTGTDNSNLNYLLFENTSTSVAVFVTVAGQGQTAAASTVPGDGTAGSITLLPLQSKVIACPSGALSVTAIGAAAGPSLITVTPVTNL